MTNLHRFTLAGFPELSAPQPFGPRFAGAQDAGVRDVALHRGGCCFRAERVEQPGIYWHDGSNEPPALVIADAAGTRHLHPVSSTPFGSAPGWIAVASVREGDTPRGTGHITLVPDEGVAGGEAASLRVPGTSVAFGGGTAVVAEPMGGRLWRVVLAEGTVREVGPLHPHTDARFDLCMSVSPDGARVVSMHVEAAQEAVWLAETDLATGQTKKLTAALPLPSWAVGTYSPRGDFVVASEMDLSTTSFRLSRIAGESRKQLFAMRCAQPRSPVAFIDDRYAVRPLTLTPHPLTTYGPVELAVFSTLAGQPRTVTKSTVGRGRPIFGDGALWVEGGEQLFRLAAGGKR